MNKTNNIRSKKTINALKNSLFKLLNEGRSIDSITVKELCETTFINRSTFYEHFKDSKDLLEKTEDEVIEKINEYMKRIMSETLDNPPMFLPMFLKYLKDNDKNFRTLLLNKSTGLEQKLIKNTISIIFNNDNIEIDKENASYINTFIKHGSMGVLVQWIESNYEKTEFEISEILYKINTGILDE